MLQRNNDCDQLSKGLPALKREEFREKRTSAFIPGGLKYHTKHASPGLTPFTPGTNCSELIMCRAKLFKTQVYPPLFRLMIEE